MWGVLSVNREVHTTAGREAGAHTPASAADESRLGLSGRGRACKKGTGLLLKGAGRFLG